MSRKKTLSLNQREKALIELIDDAVELKFDKTLIQVYTTQLKEVQKEIKEIKDIQKGKNTDERGTD